MATARVNECFDSIIENGVELLPKEAALAIKNFDEAPRKVHTNVKRYLKQVGALLETVKASGDAELLELLGLKAERAPRGRKTEEETPKRRARGEDSPQRKPRVSKVDDDFELDEEEEKPKAKRTSGKLKTVKSPLRRNQADHDDFDEDEDEVPAARVKKQAKVVRRPNVR